MGPSEPNDLYPTHIPTQNIKFEAKLTFWRRIPKTWKWGRLISGISYFQTQWVISMEMKRTHWKCTKKFSLYSFKSFGKSHHWNLVYVPLHSAPHYMIQLSWIFLYAIASPSTYPCQSVGQWVSQWVIDSFRFGDSYPISELCDLAKVGSFLYIICCSQNACTSI